MQNTKKKALSVSTGFMVVGIGAWLLLVPDSPTALPHALFYSVLILNTYFSIEFFSGIPAQSPYPKTFDAVLAVIYLFLALCAGRPILFEAAGTALFTLATVKYMFLNRIIHLQTVRRKILIDLLGAGLCAASLAGTVHGFPLESSWLLAAVFAVANIYLLLIRPMYKADNHV